MKASGNKSPTITDIARLAGVSSITVSRTFTDPGKVKAKTREKILRIASEVEYVPNVFAQNIKTSQSPIIGIVTDDTFNQSYSYVIQELCLRAEEKGYSVMIFTTGGGRESEVKAINTLVGYKAAGVVLSVISDTPDYDVSHLKILHNSPTKLIQFDRQFDTNLPAVFVNDERAGELIASVITEKAWRHILVIGGQEHSRITQARVRSICQNIPATTQVTCLYADYRYDKAKEKITAHFSSGVMNYDAIVGINGAISLAARSVATKWSLNKVEFLSIDDMPNAEDFGFFYPSVVHDYKQWATIVAENLVAAIEERPWQQRTVINGFLKNYR
ncbi:MULTISPECIES: LacI family DNA-binding transcriptional regulator [unclassified Brenneria]|uniref:LacI family DNA-binding transcriptional regulator n=1 Tax=unclassified Brenneria TaxID=2634434 RepID=UPI0015574057|nr:MULTISPECIES: LacI family DNA-binding transcriptional regulator [unclassified Brenneria]MBJ7221273.1 LacI family DNA-binding transcriptional regulator [Brenneria sp. L3-3C-1]MEE3642517.1 LacI family DNA-binding transcriptional regulator [Brenneria sp. L3_3C_1]MEE3650110.1 LacI family DNA-binding transcriptional regulator [Brenneria sp. HEZEL_4_2_4]NPD00069.1 LacI family DNA-binding transcriptional regulator [Brenneria sp. hezel4-2-4]